MLHYLLVALVGLLVTSCAKQEPVDASKAPSLQTLAVEAQKGRALPAEAPTSKPAASDFVQIRFEKLIPNEGLTVSIMTPGDTDGQTTFANRSCCGIGSVRGFVSDVRARSGEGPLTVSAGVAGWTVRHAPGDVLTIMYRLPASGETTIDSGIRDQVRPIVHDGVFHLIGYTALLLPTGRDESDLVKVDVGASGVADQAHFVSSFGPGAVRDKVVPRSEITKALYLGGRIALDVLDTPTGRVGVAYSGMASSFLAMQLSSDVKAVLDAERAFFRETQPWYLVSVRGGKRVNPRINVGGGTGLTRSFAMFVSSNLDLTNSKHREQALWVLAHEYFHQWNGLTLRVAPLPDSNRDDIATYWFSEGVTEFYAMRLLTRAGLQSPKRSLYLLNNKLAQYASNSKRGLSANAAARLFWTSREGEQIPYLRGYLAAWYADLTMKRATDGRRDLDDAMRALLARAKSEPAFRVNNVFLVDYLAEYLPLDDAAALRTFVIDGGESPLTAEIFAPCVEGGRDVEGDPLQFQFRTDTTRCFQH